MGSISSGAVFIIPVRTPAPARLLRTGPKSTEARSGQTTRQLRGCSGAISSPLHDLKTGGGRADARASCPPAPGAPLSCVPHGRCTGRGGVGRALSHHGSAWPVMLRAAGTGSQGPAPGRAGPLSGNAKAEAWLPDMLRYSRGSRPVCCCLAKRRDTALPLPRGPQPWCFFGLSFTDKARSSLTLSYPGRAVPRGTRWSSTEPSTWLLVVGSRLVARPAGTFLHFEPRLHRLPWGNL